MQLIKNLFVFINKKSRILGGWGLRRFRMVNAIHNYVARKAFGDKAEVNGYSLFIDPAEGFAVSSVWEKDTTDVIKSKFHRGGVFVDVGSDIGYYTCLAAQLGAGHIYAIEPNPHTRMLLEKNIAVNGFKNITIVGKAASDKSGEEKFYTHGAHSTLGYNYNKNTSERTTITVETMPLDVVVGDGTVNFIKMDIEGSEPKALRGMRKLLERNKQVQIITEFAPQLMALAGEDPFVFLKSLHNLGFIIYDVDNINNPMSPEELMAAYREKYKKLGDARAITNLYCAR
ncbi:MAG: FkbM family methyltransferase [Patescibacteria group bacterium]|nr:FkbM family methyltransferase [Patescibacteria group bacterium]